VPKRDAVRQAMADVFGASELEGWYLGTMNDGPESDTAEEDA
jgi:hypothetical protein